MYPAWGWEVMLEKTADTEKRLTGANVEKVLVKVESFILGILEGVEKEGIWVLLGFGVDVDGTSIVQNLKHQNINPPLLTKLKTRDAKINPKTSKSSTYILSSLHI